MSDGEARDPSVVPSTETVEPTAPAERRAPPPPLEPGTAVGRFVVLEHVASGGMGALYKAFDPQLDRSVALKLLRQDRLARADDGTSRERMLREAKVLARLAHPNVVAVFDAGTFEETVFIAMEFVEGMTLRQWLKEPRAQGAILDVLLDAGEGLAAAHAAGLIHRDFKPDNVLVGADGRARVVDFGLARAAGAASAAVGAGGPSPSVSGDAVTSASGSDGGLSSGGGPVRSKSAGTPIDAPLTEVGAFLGTPLYMAPEQHLGLEVDARADQFAFGVTLFEALYGKLPFRGKTRRDLRVAVAQGAIDWPAALPRVPSWLRAVVVRTLETAPERRFATMKDVLVALRRGRRRKGPWAMVLAVAAGALTTAAAYGALGLSRGGPVCKGAEAQLRGVWDDGRRRAMEASFIATGLPYADDALRSAERALDAYASAWVAMHTDTCVATRVRGDQSEELFDLRMQCLARAREGLRAQTDAFAAASKATVMHAVEGAQGLLPLAVCADAASLRARGRLPQGGPAKARAEQLQARLAEVRALSIIERWNEGIVKAREATAESDALALPSLQAEARIILGTIEDGSGKYEEAQKTLHTAALSARTAQDDRLFTEAMMTLAWVKGEHLGHTAEAHAWADFAEEALVRSPSAASLTARFLRIRGALFLRDTKFAEALDAAQRSVQWAEQNLGLRHSTTADCLADVADALTNLRRFDEASAYYDRAIAMTRAIFGEHHPDLAVRLVNIGILHIQTGEPERAVEETATARRIIEETMGRSHAFLVPFLKPEGHALFEAGRTGEAEARYVEALAVAEAAGSGETPEEAAVLADLAQVKGARKDYAGALAAGKRATALFEATFGAESPHLLHSLLPTGEALVGLRRVPEALAVLGRGAALADKAGESADLFVAARLRFALGRTLADGAAERGRGIAVATRARADFVAVGKRGRPWVETVDAWLERHGQR